MSLADYFTRKPVFDIFPLETDGVGLAATLHQARFSRPWNDGGATWVCCVCSASPVAMFSFFPWSKA